LEVIGLASPSAVDVTGGAHRLDVEQRLKELARSGGAVRRAIAALAGQLVAGKGFERLGYARLSEYARERLGVSARSVQEWARVDRQLAALPRLEAALVSGLLPWSKVRMLARFVTDTDEAHWIEHARRVSARTLERQARAVDRGALETGGLGDEAEDAEALEPVRVGAPSPLAFKWKRTCEYASRVAGERIPPGVALELVTAEVLSGLPVESVSETAESLPERPGLQGGGRATDQEEPTGCGPDGCAPDVCAPHEVAADAGTAEMPPFLRPLLHGLESADAHELDARLRRARRLEQRLDAEIAPLLRHVVCAGHEWRTRFHTLAAYAREHLGMSASKARALLRLERVGDVCPELRAAYRDGALSWVQSQILVPLLLWEAEGEWRPLWVRFAQGVSVRELDEAVGRALLWRQDDDPARWEACRGAPELATRPLDDVDAAEALDRQTCARPTVPSEGGSLRITAPRDVARLFRAVLCTVRRALERELGRLPSEALAFEVMIDHALRAWGVDDLWLRQRSQKKYRVFERDGWRCTVPGCSARRNLQAHHVVFRSAGGPDSLENQTTLCAFHHLRGVHAGTVRITGHAPDGLAYELGTRPDGPPLVRYRSGDRVI
jgi:hypothetical protein